jgi:hypothetical protein
MPAPIIGLAAGAAARAVAKRVASNAVKSAATKKLVKEAAKKKPLTTPKSNVKVKPAAKQVGNPPNTAKSISSKIDSVARAGGAGRGPAGKAKDSRVGNSRNIPIKTLGGRTINQELARVEKLIKKNTK